MRRRLLLQRRHAHQTDDRQFQPLPAFADEPVRFGRHDAGLLRFLAGVYLDQARWAAPAALHLSGQSLREPQPVDALDHVKSRDGVACLVGLKRADQVKRQVGKLLAQLWVFCLRLLHSVLPENAMSRGQHLPNARRRVGLADRHQCHALGGPVCCPRCRCNPLADRREIGRDNPFHSSSIPGKDRAMPITYYRASAMVAASLSLVIAACAASPPAEQSRTQPSATETQRAASSEPGDIDTEATIWTVLGLAKKESVKDPGPQTGRTVSPILWQAAHDTLDFVKYASEDPLTGSIVTDW